MAERDSVLQDAQDLLNGMQVRFDLKLECITNTREQLMTDVVLLVINKYELLQTRSRYLRGSLVLLIANQIAPNKHNASDWFATKRLLEPFNSPCSIPRHARFPCLSGWKILSFGRSQTDSLAFSWYSGFPSHQRSTPVSRWHESQGHKLLRLQKNAKKITRLLERIRF